MNTHEEGTELANLRNYLFKKKTNSENKILKFGNIIFDYKF